MRKVDVFISHANVDKPLIKPIIEALLRDGFAVFIDRPEDPGLGFSAGDIEYWRDARKRLSHLRPSEVNDYNKALLDQVRIGARAVLGCLCTPLKAGQDHLGDELFLAATDNKLILCRLGESSPSEVLAKKGGLVQFMNAQVCDIRKIAALAELLLERGVEDDGAWPEPTDAAQRQALEQYKFLRQELTNKLGGLKLGCLSARAPAALARYAQLLRVELDRVTPTAKSALIDVLRHQGISALADTLNEKNILYFIDLAMNIEPMDLLDAFARALDLLYEQRAPETDANGLRRAAHVIVPLISDQSDVDRVQRALDGASLDIFEPRIGSGTMAEVVMAAAERKSTDFLPRRKKGEMPIGRTAVTLGAEAGPEDREARDVAALMLELQKMKGVEIDASRVQARVKQVLQNDLGITLTDKKVRDEMARNKKMNRRRYYLIADKPQEPVAHDYLRAVLRQVQDATPELAAIIIDPALSDEEYALVQAVRDIVELEGGKG